jgi:hypothetical protein
MIQDLPKLKTGTNMKRNSILAAVLTGTVAMLAAAGAQAANNYSNAFVTITNLVFYSATDDVYPLYDGTVVINFAQPVVWTFGGPCATGSVAIHSVDAPLMTAVQTALATGRPIQVFVDDSKTVDGVVCWLRAVEM